MNDENAITIDPEHRTAAETQLALLGPTHRGRSLLASGAGLLSLALLAPAGWLLYSAFGIKHQMPLPPALKAQRTEFDGGPAGRLSYYVDREHWGQPLVLVHSVNAAASSFEMRPLFEHYRRQRPVFALDLPGYGFSDRSDRVYSPEMFTQAIVELIRTQVGQPAHVIALSLGCEFAARAARAHPDLIRSLVLISPSGLGKGKGGRSSQQAGSVGLSDGLHSLLAFPLWGQGLYDVIATRRSIAYFLRQSFVSAPPTSLIDYAFATSHQPGARYAPLYFLSGGLFTASVRQDVYATLSTPALVLYDQDAFVRFDALPDLLAANAAIQAVQITPTLGLTHWEKPDETTQAIDGFWQHLGEVDMAPGAKRT